MNIWPYAPPIIAALAVTVLALVDVRCAPDRKKALRASMAAIGFYLTLLYVGVAADWWKDAYVVKSGIATRFGVTVALILVALEIYTDRRDSQCRPN